MSFLGIKNPWAFLGPRGFDAWSKPVPNQSTEDSFLGAMMPTRTLEKQNFSNPYTGVSGTNGLGTMTTYSQNGNPFRMEGN